MTPGVPRLLAVTDPGAPLGPELEAWLRALAGAGVGGVQVRRKELSDRALLALAERCRGALPAPVRLLVNGRLDVAVAAGADGVHLPSRGLPTGAVRRLAEGLGLPALIGRSTHRPEEVARAREEGADYATFGPVYPTPSKAGYGPPPGLSGLERAAAFGLPVLALGGVTLERLKEVAEAGATGAAGIRVFHDLPRLPALVAEARRVFQGGPPW